MSEKLSVFLPSMDISAKLVSDLFEALSSHNSIAVYVLLTIVVAVVIWWNSVAVFLPKGPRGSVFLPKQRQGMKLSRLAIRAYSACVEL